MSNVLLLQEGSNSETIIQQALSVQGHSFTCLDLDDFHPDMLFFQIFDLIILAIPNEPGSCVVILQQLERLTLTSGLEHPPIIVVSAKSSDSVEQLIRATKVDFYLVQPVTRTELLSAIEQALL